MSKFCENCGAKLDDSAMFCDNCGNSVASNEQPITNTAPSNAQAANFEQASVNPAKKILANKPLLFGIIGGAAAVVILVVVLLIVFFGGSKYDDALEAYFDASIGKYENFEDLAPEAYWSDVEARTKRSRLDMIKYYEAQNYEWTKEAEEDYGKNLEVSYKILEEKDLGNAYLKAIQEDLKDSFNISTRTVTAAVALSVEVTISGDFDEKTATKTLYLVEIDGDWYLTQGYSFAGGELSKTTFDGMPLDINKYLADSIANLEDDIASADDLLSSYK